MSRNQTDNTFSRHMLYMTPDTETELKHALDKYGDSYTRDVTLDDLREVSISCVGIVISISM